MNGPEERDQPDYRADRRYILKELSRLDEKQERMGTEFSTVREHMVPQGRFDRLEERVRYCESALVGLKVRASVWGGMSGLIPVVMWLAFRAITAK